MNLLIILLGCNILQILQDRLDTLFEFITNTNQLIDTGTYMNITIFLSGGIKNDVPGAKSEASVMRSLIDNSIGLKSLNENQNNNNSYGNSYGNSYVNSVEWSDNNKQKPKQILWNFVLDEKSTNTAENFIRASDFINSSKSIYSDVYVVTSEFHKPRAKLMLNLIDPSREYKWILGKYSQTDSQYWESVHIKNVFNDIDKAKKSIGIF
jgi:hypothetical protein